jgi:hypothetical protein
MKIDIKNIFVDFTHLGSDDCIYSGFSHGNSRPLEGQGTLPQKKK